MIQDGLLTEDDLALVIEVADSSLEHDRGIKLRSYARAGIVCYWIVNLIDRQIEVYTRPEPTAEVPGYRDRQTFEAGESVSLNIAGQVAAGIPVSDLLPV